MSSRKNAKFSMRHPRSYDFNQPITLLLKMKHITFTIQYFHVV